MKFIPHRNVAQGPQIETVKKTRTETNYSTERNDELGNIFIAPIMRSGNGVKRRIQTVRKKIQIEFVVQSNIKKKLIESKTYALCYPNIIQQTGNENNQTYQVVR